MPEEYRRPGDSVARRVVDYIAGMTDQYAMGLAESFDRLRMSGEG